MPAFASLSEQKRGSDALAARRASMSDQEQKGGIFSQFFHKYVTHCPLPHANTTHTPLLPPLTHVTDDETPLSNFGKNAGK